MHRCTRMFQLIFVTIFASAPAVFAQESSPMPAPEAAGQAPDTTPPAEPGTTPADGGEPRRSRRHRTRHRGQ